MQNQPALVGIVPRKNLWPLIQKEKWYHIPVESAPRNADLIEYLAFYFPKEFGKEERYKVNYYSKVSKIDVVKRIKLFPNEPRHERALEDYYKFNLGQIRKLPKPVLNRSSREIFHIPTSKQKLFTAKEINDLYDTSPLEEKMYREMKKQKIEAERQVFIKIDDKNYYLDFGIFCKEGSIDIECDGEKYHILPDALTKDRKRNNQLTSFGWQVLRFSGKEINYELENCIRIIKKTVNNLGGLMPAVNLKTIL